MNNVQLLGRLVRDPEIRVSQSQTSVARYTLAVNRFKSDEADFINIVAFNKAAEFAQKYFKKGQQVAIVGRIQTGNYTDKNGTKRNTFDIVAEHQYFADSKKDSFQEVNEPIPEEFDQEGLPF